MICYSESGEPRLSIGYKFVGLPWKLLKLYPTVHSYLFFSSHSIVLFPLRTPTTWRIAKCTRRLFRLWRDCPNSKLICYSERGEARLSFGYKFAGLPWKLLKLYPTVHSYLFFSSHTIVLFPLRTPTTWVSAKCTRRLFKLWRSWPNSKLICYSERGEGRLSFGYKFVGLPWKLLKLYPTVHSYLFFSSHSIVLFPLRTPTTWVSAKCTRRLFKLWRSWPNSKLICYSERGDARLSIGYKFLGLPWKLLKLYPTVHSYLFFSSHSIVLFPLRTTATWRIAKCTRMHFKVWRNWPSSKLICYSERGEPRLSFGYIFFGHPWKNLKLYPTVQSNFCFFIHTVLYCFHWEHRQLEWVLSVHGGSLSYDGVGQIQNWYVILKGEKLGFHLDINLSACLENF